MINFLQKIYAPLYTFNKKYRLKRKNLFGKITNRMVMILEKWICSAVSVRGKMGMMPKKLDNNNKLVVSFTSFPARIGGVWMVVDSLMRQTFLPREILLYLSREQFPNERNDLPESLLKYEPLGLKIIFEDDDLRPHKKYFYASQTLEDECFVTVDDDTVYRKDVLQKLWAMHEKHPNAVCANNVRRMAIKDGSVQPYKDWKEIIEDAVIVDQPDTVAIGVGGILYPPAFYKNNDKLLDVEAIKSTCLKADDLWLKVMEILSDTPLVAATYYPNPPSLPGTHQTALSQTNRLNGKTGNDEQWEALDKWFGINNIILEKLKTRPN